MWGSLFLPVFPRILVPLMMLAHVHTGTHKDTCGVSGLFADSSLSTGEERRAV